MEFIRKNFPAIMLIFAVVSLGLQAYLCWERSQAKGGCGCGNGDKSEEMVPSANGLIPEPIR